MQVNTFLQAVRARPIPPKWKGMFSMPNISKTELVEAAEVTPTIVSGSRGYAYIFDFDDGKVMLTGPPSFGDQLASPTACVARPTPQRLA